MDESTFSLVTLAVIAGVGVAMAFGVYGLTRIVSNVAREHQSERIVVVVLLAIITTLVVVAYTVTALDDLGVLAGTGLGALAGAVTAIYRDTPPPDDDEGD